MSDAVQRVWTTDLTGTKLYDAIYKAIEDTRDYVTSSGGVGSVVVVSEGKDENNDIGGPGSEHSRHELIDLAYNNGIRIFTVGVGSVIEGVLKEIAYETGGSYFYAPTPSDLTTVPSAIAAQFYGTYVVFYDTSITNCQDHTLEISVTANTESGVDSESFRTCAQDLDVNPSEINFGSVDTGEIKTTNVTLCNLGIPYLTVDAISAPNEPFSLTTVPPLPATLGQGNCIEFAVTFAPTAPGDFTDNVTITSNDPDEPSFNIPLSGTGISPADISITPLNINFGDVLLGDPKTTNVTITNEGTLDLTVISIAEPVDPFSLSTVPALPAVIASGGSIVFGVTFAPTEAGGFDATVIVASDDQDEPSIGIPLSGTAKSSLTIESPQGPITVATSKGQITNLSLVDVSTLPAEGKPNASFPYGLFSFSIEVGSPFGQIVNIEITLPGNLSTDAQYWKYGPKTAGGPDEWYSIQLGSNDGDNIVTIQVEDGGLGDGDCEQDGSIVDPGGPAITAGAPSGGGGGGGCSMSNPEGQINIGHQLILLGIFALGLLVWRERRRR